MKLLVLLVLLVTACDQATAPNAGPDGMKCVRKGDTVGVMRTYKGDSVTVYWFLAQKDTGCD